MGQLSPTTGFLTHGAYTDYRFDIIRHSLYFLENIALLEDVDPSVIDNMEGQARFILAFRYFRMARSYGDVPLFQKVLTLDEVLETSARTPQKEVFEYILENIDISISKLSDVHDKSGIITQDAALMLKTEILMWMASLDDFRATKDIR